MSLTKIEIGQIREELINCQRPLFFFDDDPDGLCSFLLLYRFKKEGKGIVIKSKPYVDDKFTHIVHEYQPDKLFILDMAIVEQDFIDNANVPIIWIDHHEAIKRNNVKYFNPRRNEPNEYYPTTAMCYDIVKQDVWIAAVGCIADMHMPRFLSKFKKEYKGYIQKGMKKTDDIYFKTRLGELIRIFSFLLKGKTLDVNKNFKILTRISHPDELLNQTSAAGKFLFKMYLNATRDYEKLISQARKIESKNNIVLFIYQENKMSFTGDLANELIYEFPKNVVIVGRKKDGEVRMSLRSKNINLREALSKALVGIDGYGGGHEFACGANVKEHDFDRFLDNLSIAIQ